MVIVSIFAFRMTQTPKNGGKTFFAESSITFAEVSKQKFDVLIFFFLNKNQFDGVCVCMRIAIQSNLYAFDANLFVEQWAMTMDVCVCICFAKAKP